MQKSEAWRWGCVSRNLRIYIVLTGAADETSSFGGQLGSTAWDAILKDIMALPRGIPEALGICGYHYCGYFAITGDLEGMP